MLGTVTEEEEEGGDAAPAVPVDASGVPGTRSRGPSATAAVAPAAGGAGAGEALQSALRHFVHDIIDRCRFNRALTDLLAWNQDQLVDVVRLFAEAVLNAECQQAVLAALVTTHDLSDSALRYAAQYSNMYGLGVIGDVRGWGARVLWTLVRVFKERGVNLSVLQDMGGFEGVLLKGYLEPDPGHRPHAFVHPVYMALLEILVGTIFSPSEASEQVVECFGKPIQNPSIISLIMRLTPLSESWELKRDILKELNVVLVKREQNFGSFLQQEGWQTWIAPLLAPLPVSEEARSEVQNDFLKYTNNLFAMIFHHVFSKSEEDIDKVLHRCFVQLQLQAGWGEDAVAVGRSLLHSLLVKVGNGAKRWQTSYDSPEWSQLLKLASFIEEFLFYRPVQEQVDEVTEEPEVPTMLQLRSELRGAVPQPIAPYNIPKVDRRNIGVHIGSSGELEDLKLAQRMCNVLEKLGMPSEEAMGAMTTLKKTCRETLSFGGTTLKLFKDIVHFFEAHGPKSGDAEETSRFIEALGGFLEKRQRRGGGFLSGSVNKKNIVKSLQTSVMRQQAQKTIRSQVRSTVMKAKAPIVMHADCGEESVLAKGECGKLVRGRNSLGDVVSMLAVDSVDSTAPGAGATASAGAGEASGDSGAGPDADPKDGQLSNDTLCASCHQALLNDDGISALGSVFHVDCFVCTHCEKAFREQPYYVRSGRAYCKSDYLSLFAKSVCAGCMGSFRKGDVAMEAVNKMWHPEHFACESCSRPFDLEETYYDKDGKPYCTSCNERLFLTCPSCQLPVTEDQDGISALSRNWHREHFVCAHGGCLFEDGVYFTKDTGDGKGERPYCELHYMELFVPKCRGCTLPIKETGVSACSASWHTDHFVCVTCKKPFEDGQYFEVDCNPYCADDYWDKFGQRCAGCDGVIREQVMNALNQTWHVEHFVCTDCGCAFPDMVFFEKDGKPYCQNDYAKRFCEKCPSCDEYVLEGGVIALDRTWHADHLICTQCGCRLSESAHMGDDGKLYCKKDFVAAFAPKCGGCKLAIEGDAVAALEQQWHPECFVCTQCRGPLESFRSHEGSPYCETHYLELFGAVCAACGLKVLPSAQIKFLDQPMHMECLKCAGPCGAPIDVTAKIFPKDGAPWCEGCFIATCELCAGCSTAILGPFLNVLGRKYHKGCLKCVACDKEFTDGKMFNRSGWPVCADHARGPLPAEVQEKISGGTKP